MDKHDVVYFLKDNLETEELKYSLRSIAKNSITEMYGS